MTNIYDIANKLSSYEQSTFAGTTNQHVEESSGLIQRESGSLILRDFTCVKLSELNIFQKMYYWFTGQFQNAESLADRLLTVIEPTQLQHLGNDSDTALDALTTVLSKVELIKERVLRSRGLPDDAIIQEVDGRDKDFLSTINSSINHLENLITEESRLQAFSPQTGDPSTPPPSPVDIKLPVDIQYKPTYTYPESPKKPTPVEQQRSCIEDDSAFHLDPPKIPMPY